MGGLLDETDYPFLYWFPYSGAWRKEDRWPESNMDDVPLPTRERKIEEKACQKVT